MEGQATTKHWTGLKSVGNENIMWKTINYLGRFDLSRIVFDAQGRVSLVDLFVGRRTVLTTPTTKTFAATAKDTHSG